MDITGVVGGSGFYSFLSDVDEVVVDTPYGSPSAPVTVGQLAGGVEGLEEHAVGRAGAADDRDLAGSR